MVMVRLLIRIISSYFHLWRAWNVLICFLFYFIYSFLGKNVDKMYSLWFHKTRHHSMKLFECPNPNYLLEFSIRLRRTRRRTWVKMNKIRSLLFAKVANTETFRRTILWMPSRLPVEIYWNSYSSYWTMM